MNSATVSAFTTVEFAVAGAGALGVQTFVVLLLLFASNDSHINAKEPPIVKEVPMKVAPVLDDAPLLKLGGKKVAAKLPKEWQKPVAVKREVAASQPSPDADVNKTDKLPETDLAKPDAQAPKTDAEVAKDPTDLTDASPDAKPDDEAPEKGHADGHKDGTETDPLKARQVNLYRAKIAGWFSARFKQPVGAVPCEELGKLRASVTASVGGDRSVTGYSISGPSGNAAFDARVRQTMESVKGQQLPPPPPLYPDILGSTVFPVFAGQKQKCAGSVTPPKSGGGGDDKAPDKPKPPAPAPPELPEGD